MTACTFFKQDEKYGEIYNAEDFPIAVSLQQRLYFQISVDTPDTRLGIVADACFATPVRRRTTQEKYDIITDRSVSVVSSSRFSLLRVDLIYH